MKLTQVSFAIACAVPLLAGCAWRASAPALQVDTAPVVVDPTPVAVVEEAPVTVEAYPQTVYEGRTVYLYHNRWYFRDGPRWRYYHREPGFLRDHRGRLEFGPGHREEHHERIERRR